MRICLLEKGHDKAGFDCGKQQLNEYLQKFARQTQERDGSRTYVALEGNQVIAYYTLVVGDVEWKDCPPELSKGLGKYPIPVLIIARLAVDRRFHGAGLGIGMIKDAFNRALAVSDIAGVAAVIVDAKDKEAKAYYERKKIGFTPIPGDSMRLYIPISIIRANIKPDSKPH
jgi:predicted N-acetyltransferase YhbS